MNKYKSYNNMKSSKDIEKEYTPEEIDETIVFPAPKIQENGRRYLKNFENTEKDLG